MLFLTRAHQDSHGERVFSDQELMDAVRQYGEGADAKRTLNLDKAALRARGLIQTGRPHPGEAHRRGTRRAPYLEKAASLWLTPEEHALLREVRAARLSRSRLPVGPTCSPPRPMGRTNASVDEAFRLLRLLEEYGGEVGVAVVADCFGVGEARARNWLVQMADGFDDFDVLEVLYEDDGVAGFEDDVDGPDPVVSAVALRLHGRALAETGTALLGLFAYSRPEVEERLALIAEHRRVEDLDAGVAERLKEIEWKLTRWAEQLPDGPG